MNYFALVSVHESNTSNAADQYSQATMCCRGFLRSGTVLVANGPGFGVVLECTVHTPSVLEKSVPAVVRNLQAPNPCLQSAPFDRVLFWCSSAAGKGHLRDAPAAQPCQGSAEESGAVKDKLERHE
ncbi:hypothetical protein VTI28DRAFT_10104 [Corynascus sepedonium]